MARKHLHSIGIRIKCLNCREFFVVCPPCYRGHKYCSDGCSREGRRRGKMRADRDYRSTARGREKRRFSQNRYRKRLKLKGTSEKSKIKNVNDQSSPQTSQDVSKKPKDFVFVPKLPSQMSCMKCGIDVKFLVSVSWRWFKGGKNFDYRSKYQGSDEEDVLCRAPPHKFYS